MSQLSIQTSSSNSQLGLDAESVSKLASPNTTSVRSIPSPSEPSFSLAEIIKHSIITTETKPRETFGFVVGPRNSGKSSVIGRWLDRTEQQPSQSSNFSLEYSYSYKIKPLSSTKDTVHIWELSGEDLSKWIELAVNDTNIHEAFVVICCDLTQPVKTLRSVLSLLMQIHQFVDLRLDSLEKRGSKRPKIMRANAAKKGWINHPDLNLVKISPISIAVIITKADQLSKFDTETQKLIGMSMRLISHLFGASLLFCNKENQESIQYSKRLFNQFAFKQPMKLSAPSQETLFFPASADTLSDILLPSQIMQNVKAGNIKKAIAELETVFGQTTGKLQNVEAPKTTLQPKDYPENALDISISDMRAALQTRV